MTGRARNALTPTATALLEDLYGQVLNRNPEDRYIKLHSQPNSIKRQVEIFSRYREYLPSSGNILDWGCNHAPDSCLIKHEYQDRFRLYGFDFDRGNAHKEFHDFAQLDFATAEHVYRLPYTDGLFAGAISGGVLEHVAFPNESLKELYRVLADDGRLIITFLPNKWSYTELVERLLGRGHKRRFTKRSASRLLLDHGFEVTQIGYHQFVPAQRGPKFLESLWFLNSSLERLWPTRLLCANLFVIATKRRVM